MAYSFQQYQSLTFESLEKFFQDFIWPDLKNASDEPAATAIIDAAFDAVELAFASRSQEQDVLISVQYSVWLDRWRNRNFSMTPTGDPTGKWATPWPKLGRILGGIAIAGAVLGIGYLLYANHSRY